ncbi:MAG: PhzF family phenazine biosynthesis protein [Pseudomonadota bacterium]
MDKRRFHQVDVFTAEPLRGNALAVVHDAQGLAEEQMAAFARWTNLSETTFLLPPAHPEADYRVRILTPGGELPFAGHPTLGSCFAWLAAGGRPQRADEVVQECGVGLVRIKREGARLAFAAPPTRVEAVDPALLESVCAALGLQPRQVKAGAWLTNGPRQLALEVDSAETVLALQPDHGALAKLCDVGLVGRYPAGQHEADVEVRFFVPLHGVPEDPVTGSFNANLARWLMADGRLPRRYVASQGSCMGRAGRVHLHDDGQSLWVGGEVVPLVEGSLSL